MALRCLLVGLVASLGFELPSGQEVTSWTRPGRDWVAARTITLADLQANAATWLGGAEPAAPPAVAPALVAVPVPSAEAIPDDLAFVAINEAMASSFAADFAVAQLEEAADAAAEQAPAPAAEAIAAVTNEPELESMALAHAEPEASASADPVEATDESGSTPASRLNLAVRATRQAMDAWTSLVQAVGREVVAR